MNIKHILKASFLLLASLSIITLSSCGGSGSDAEEGGPTIRPKSLDGITMGISGLGMRFIKGGSSGSADKTGDIEQGTLLYFPQPPYVQGMTSLDPSITVPLSVVFPSTADGLSYQYTGIDSSTGTITISQSGTSGYTTGGGYASNVIHDFFGPGNSFNITVNFVSNGSTIQTSTVDITDLDETTTNVVDLTRGNMGQTPPDFVFQIDELGQSGFSLPRATTTAAFSLGSGPVPENYTSDQNPDPRGVQDITLNGREVVFTDSLNSNNDFSIIFTRTTGQDIDAIESGNITYLNSDGSQSLGGTYTYEEIRTAEYSLLTIISSSGPLNQIPEAGTITMTFTSSSSITQNSIGPYQSSGSGNSGTFTVKIP